MSEEKLKRAIEFLELIYSENSIRENQSNEIQEGLVLIRNGLPMHDLLFSQLTFKVVIC